MEMQSIKNIHQAEFFPDVVVQPVDFPLTGQQWVHDQTVRVSQSSNSIIFTVVQIHRGKVQMGFDMPKGVFDEKSF